MWAKMEKWNILIGEPIPNKKMKNLFGIFINEKMNTLFKNIGSKLHFSKVYNEILYLRKNPNWEHHKTQKTLCA